MNNPIRLIAVRLDDPRIGAGPGTVVAFVGSAAEYERMITDRDGARDDRMRMWSAYDGVKVGDRCSLRGTPS